MERQTDRVDIHGTALRTVRELANLSRAELAKAGGISTPYLNRLETGERKRCARVVYERMLERLGIGPDNYGALLIPASSTSCDSKAPAA